VAGSDTTNKDDGHLVFRTSPSQGSITERLRIDSGGTATFAGNVTISGNLSVTGTTSQNNSVSTAQKTITLASGAANNAAVDGAGIVVDAGSDTDKTLKWLDNTDRWTFTGGDVAANAFYGDGSNLTGLNVAINTLNNASNNRILTSEGGTTVNSEANLTFDGSTVGLNGDIAASNNAWIYSTSGGSGVRAGINYNGTSQYLAFYTAGSSSSNERVRIDSGGSVSIGDAATHTFSAHSEGDDLVVGGAGWRGMTIYGEGGGGVIQFADNADNRVGQIMYYHAENSMSFRVNGNVTRLKIDSDGKLLQGVTSGVPVCSTANARLQVHNNASVLTASFTGYGAHSGGSIIALGKSRSNTIGDATGAVQSGDTLGDIRFGGSDGTDMHNTAAQILGVVDGSVSSNTLPGRLIFQTNSGSGNAERLRIDSAGNMSLGKQAAASTNYGANFQIHDTGTNGATLHLTTSQTGSSNSDGFHLVQQGSHLYHWLRESGDQVFATNANERLRITSGGVVKIGGDVSNAGADVGTVTKLTIKQHTNTHEGGMYIERSGERRGYYIYVGGAGGYNDALSITSNQLGTDTNILAIDRGNRLAKLGGDVIIDSSNNGYGGLRIYDDTSGDYNVRYIAGRNQAATAHVFMDSGRSQNQSPWTDATPAESVRLTRGSGISFKGDNDSSLGQHTSDHLKIKTGDKDVAHFDNRRVVTIAKLQTKAQCFSSCTTKWANSRSVMRFYMDFYTGNSSATYHFMRLISQPDWSFDDIVIRQTRYQYHPASNDHSTRRYYTWYGSHTEQIINYNQQSGGSGTGADNWITKRDNFGPSGAFKIHTAANGGYYRDAWGSDYAISLGNYIGVRLEITIYNSTGVYDTSRFATASDFYPAAYGGQATQSAADSWGGPRGVWFNTTSNGTGTGTAPVLRMHDNAATGWSTGTSFFDTSA